MFTVADVFFSKPLEKMSRRPVALRGGLAEGYNPSDFSDNQLWAGILVEMEHTRDPEVAMFIAMDHLTEHPRYYTHLARMERGLANTQRRKTRKSRRRGR